MAGEDNEPITRGIDTSGFRSGIGGDLWSEREEALESKLKHARERETPLANRSEWSSLPNDTTQYRNLGTEQIDILSRAFRQEQPAFTAGERESTNVEDRRGETLAQAQARWNRERAAYRRGEGPELDWPDEDPKKRALMREMDPNSPNPIWPDQLPRGFEHLQRVVGISPYASPDRVKKAWDTAIEVGKGFMEDVNQTLQALINPTAEITAEPGTEDRYAQEMLAQRAQGRAAARVGVDLATAGMSRAVGASEAAVGAFGGRLPNRAKIREGMEARVVYDDAAKAEFRIGTPEGKKVGEYTVMEGSVPNTLSIENIVVNKEFQRQGVARDVYAQLRAQAGDKEVIPSGSLQEGTYRLWKEMNPKLLEAGKYKKLKDGSYERTDDNFTSYFTQATE